MLKWALLMITGIAGASVVVFYTIYHLALGVQLTKLTEPWLASLILSAFFAPLFYLGRKKIVVSDNTKLFYVVCAVYSICICFLMVHYAVRFGLLAYQAANPYYAAILAIIPAAMVIAYFGNKALFRQSRH